MNFIKVFGLEKTVAFFKKSKSDTHVKLRRGLLKGGFFLQRRAQTLVPKEFGVLVNSAKTQFGKTGPGEDVAVDVFFNTAYALWVHEILENKHAPGTQAKYLEQPAREEAGEIHRVIVAEMRKDV